MLFVNASLSYRGRLITLCVPAGSIWTLPVSDTPVVRSAIPNTFVGDKATAFEQAMRSRQLGDKPPIGRQWPA
jgi:hypothetical protein